MKTIGIYSLALAASVQAQTFSGQIGNLKYHGNFKIYNLGDFGFLAIDKPMMGSDCSSHKGIGQIHSNPYAVTDVQNPHDFPPISDTERNSEQPGIHQSDPTFTLADFAPYTTSDNDEDRCVSVTFLSDVSNIKEHGSVVVEDGQGTDFGNFVSGRGWNRVGQRDSNNGLTRYALQLAEDRQTMSIMAYGYDMSVSDVTSIADVMDVNFSWESYDNRGCKGGHTSSETHPMNSWRTLSEIPKGLKIRYMMDSGDEITECINIKSRNGKAKTNNWSKNGHVLKLQSDEIHDRSDNIWMRLSQDNLFCPTRYEFQYDHKAGDNVVGKYHVHQTRLSTATAGMHCGKTSTGGHWNPYLVGSPTMSPADADNDLYFEVGDLSSKYGVLAYDDGTPKSVSIDMWDYNLPLAGESVNSVSSRNSIVLHNTDGSRYMCWNLNRLED